MKAADAYRDDWRKIPIPLTYTSVMPGGTRFGHPRSPVTLVAVVILLFVLVWVILHVSGWLR